MTLALMEDTGWYRADYSHAQRLDWGRGLGCDFVMKSCKFWMDKQRQRSEVTAVQLEYTTTLLHLQYTTTPTVHLQYTTTPTVHYYTYNTLLH